ncbi:4Fe-4S binding protein, partial [bacterium]|nr:4Fe-4S binding protein [bacterium]
NFLAYIDPEKCIACGKCIAVCPTKAIEATFEMPKPKPKPAPKVEAEGGDKS